jgi:hypothetical protein
MDYGFRRPKEPWEATDGAIYLLRELAQVLLMSWSNHPVCLPIAAWSSQQPGAGLVGQCFHARHAA